jgi:CheY-like chemotaxis protein
MPHMDGFEMIRNVLADAETRPRLMIAVSAKSPNELADFGRLPTEVLLPRKSLLRQPYIDALCRPCMSVSSVPVPASASAQCDWCFGRRSTDGIVGFVVRHASCS